MECINWLVNDIRKAIGCICCLVFAGPVLFIIGLALLLSSPFSDSRVNNLNDINSAIFIWSDHARAEFANNTISVSSAYRPSPQLLSPTTPSFSSEMQDTDGVDNYSPLYFNLYATNAIIPPQPFNENAVYYVDFTVKNDKTSNISIPISLFYQGIDSNQTSRTCTSSGGQVVGNTCYVYYALSSLCIKISETANGWDADPQYGGAGCEYDAVNGVFKPGKYEKIPYNNGAVKTSNHTFAIQTSVRSQQDPFIAAQEITEGTMNFGLTKAQVAGTGLIIMIIGLIFMIPCCCVTGLTIYYFQRKRRHH